MKLESVIAFAIVRPAFVASLYTARRLIDFFSGAVYGVDGHIERVSATIFLLVPYNVDILNTAKDERSKGTFPWIK